MKCAQIRKYGGRYKDGDVSPAMRVKIDAHVVTCEACKAAFEDMKVIGAMFARTAAPAIPEGMLDAILDKVVRKTCENAEEEYILAGWWATSRPSVRIACSLVLLVLMSAGIYMGGDLWKNKAATTVAVGYDGDYPGIDAFMAMQPGSIEKTYFELTSDETGRGKR